MTRKASVTELFEDDLGQSGIGAAAETRVRKLHEGGVMVESVEGTLVEESVQKIGERLRSGLIDEFLGAEPV